jgi:hypothetical protein
MIGRTATQKTWTAIGFLLNNAASRRDGSRSEWIGGTKYRNDGQTHGSGNVHGARIVANKEMALG